MGTICMNLLSKSIKQSAVTQRPFQLGDALDVVADVPSVKDVMHASCSCKK